MEQEFSEFRETDKSRSMNLSQFKDLASHMCLAGMVVASWFLTTEVAGSNPLTIMTDISITEFSDIQ